MAGQMKDATPALGAVPADQWSHRSVRMRCATCMWFVFKAGDNEAVSDNSLGRCRRHSPNLAGFPAVFGLDWCGDHKLDEKKAW